MRTKIMITVLAMSVIHYLHIDAMANNRALNGDEQSLYQALTTTGNIDINQLNTIVTQGGHNIDYNALLPYSDGPTYLNIAVRNMNLAAVQLLINNGADPNFRNPIANIPVGAFIYRVRNPQASTDDINRLCLPIIQSLVAAGADINSADSDGETLLHTLARINFVQSALYVLGRLEGNPLPDGAIPADTNAINDAGQRPIDIAATEYGEDSDIYRAIMDVQIW